MNRDRNYMPKLRQVEPVQLVLEGRQVVALKDPLQLTGRMLCVQPGVLPVLAMLDGTHSLLDIQADLTRRTGRMVFLDDISSLVETLDEALLLESDRSREASQRKRLEFRQSLFRPASHAGMSYAADPTELKQELKSFFSREDGPGLPDFFADPRRPVGLIAPHIDIRAGGRCFAQAYHALGSCQPSDIYVILGTGHSGVDGMFTACTLDFQTPLGTVETDREFIGSLSRNLGRDAAAEEMLHASEHVIEFQVLFLQYLFADRHPFKIVPILCALSHHLFDDDGRLADQLQMFHEFCTALKKTCSESSRSVCFIASADLDHIGPRYGDSFVPHGGTIAESLEKDDSMLKRLEDLDVTGFIRAVVSEGDARRICGFSPITTMFHSMDASAGRLLSLDYAQVDNRNSFVSFASMIFH
jgi:MEMO1 family protein